MNKTLLAAAALVVISGSALAQSSVTLYGVVDASVEAIKGTNSLNRVSSDNLASSRLGFRGAEDLGAGLKAKFVLEASLKPDTGAADSTRFFGRAAWVGLEGGFGEIRLGRQDSSIGALAGNTNILGAQDYDDLKFAGTFAGDSFRRVDNAITYILPKFVDGLAAQIQYSTNASGAEESDDRGQGFGFSVAYAGGPFGAGLGYIDSKNTTAPTADDKLTGLLVFGSYDFSGVKLTAYYNVDDSETREAALAAAGTYDKRDVVGLKVGFPLGNNFGLTIGVSKVSSANFVENADATVFALKGVYSLTKRTALYGIVTSVDNDDTANLGVAKIATDFGKNSSGVAFGVRHTF